MLLAVTDTETTGTGETDQVVELAIAVVRPADPESPGPIYESERRQWSTLICPTVPVALEARAVHHLGPEELDGAPTFKDFLADNKGLWGLRDLNHDEPVLVAHNAAFDLQMLRQSCLAADADPSEVLPWRSICTWRCAQTIYPDAPKHGNQVLRYYLDLDDRYGPLGTDLPPHRALPDAVVTSWLVSDMLTRHSAEELIAMTEAPILQKVCRMPKHVGKTWEEVSKVDPSYMRWMLSQGPLIILPGGNKTGFDDDTIYTLKFHLGLL